MKYWILIAGLVPISCKTPERTSSKPKASESESETWMEFVPTRPTKLKQCVALRGNGNYIFAHWHSLARIIENYGPMDAFAGSSSGSISGFLYESIYLNPAVYACKSKMCSERERSQRIALLLKSLSEFVSLIGKMKVENAFSAAFDVIRNLQNIERQSGNSKTTNPAILAKQIKESLEKYGVMDIVNPRYKARLEAALSSVEEARLNAPDLIAPLKALEWKAADIGIFLRDGVISFDVLARRISQFGNFYAGRDRASLGAIKIFLDQCSDKSHNLSWPEIRELQGKNTPTCGDLFSNAARPFFERLKNNTLKIENDRGMDAVGEYLPGFVATSIIMNQTGLNTLWKTLNAFDERSTADQTPSMIELTLHNDLRFGYWGQEQDLDSVRHSLRTSYGAFSYEGRTIRDLKSSLFWKLPTESWEQVMAVGPQEPGLGSIRCRVATKKWIDLREDPDSCLLASAGGWADLEPTLVLKAAGCENVYLITRRGDQSHYVGDIAKLLNINEQARKELFESILEPTIPNSSVKLSLYEADAVWCTNWNHISATKISDILHRPYCESDWIVRDTTHANHRNKFFSCANELGVSHKRPLPKSRKDAPYVGCAFGGTVQ